MSGDGEGSRQEEELRLMARAAARGELYATERLIRGLHGPLHRILYFLGVPEGDIDDVAQNTVIQMYQSLARYDDERPFVPWLRSIAQHVVANYWRSRARERSNKGRFRAYVAELVQRGDALATAQPRRDQLEDCIDRLGEKQREVVTLCYFEGRTSDEISGLVHRSPVAIRQMLSRARSLLKRCLESKPAAAGR